MFKHPTAHRRSVFLGLASLASTPSGARAAEGRELAKKLYSFRGFDDGAFSFTLRTEVYRPSRSPTWSQATVYFRSHEQVRIEYQEPASYAGRRLLFDGPQLWLRTPGSQRLIRLTLADRLMGEASNGDAVNADFRRYDILLKGEERYDGRTLARLTLTAKPSETVAYATLHYLVDPNTGRPAFSFHYAPSGKLLKIGTYEDFLTVGNREFVRSLKFSEPADPARFTRMIHGAYRRRSLPAAIFEKSSLETPFAQGSR